MSAAPPGTSIAARLVLLFVAGSSLIMAGVGYTHYHALREQLYAKELAEVVGKTEVIEHLFGELETPREFLANVQRFRDISVGHPHLSIGLRSKGVWLLKPADERVASAAQAAVDAPQWPYAEALLGERTWWLRSIEHSWRGAESLDVTAVLAIDVTETRQLLRDHAAIAALVALVGTVLSALLGWLVAQRGLAPIAQVAARAEQVTAQRLGARLDLKDAPREVQGLGESINRMLERLEESFRTLEQFSADIAHELRTPLNNLLLQTQVTLSRPRAVVEYQETLHSNLVELERMQRMVADMLFLARADRGMLELAVEEIELGPEAASVTEYFEAAASERDQPIRIRGSAAVKGDRLMIRRAITNLLSNAVRYSPPGTPIDVETGRDRNGPYVAVSNEAARSSAAEGTGLGLAIVDSIMKLHRGRLETENTPHRVVFRLRFGA